MSLVIRKWWGRLGNNIIQLRHAIQIAIYYKYDIIMPKHPYFNTTFVKFGADKNRKNKLYDGYNFYFKHRIKKYIPYIDDKVFQLNIKDTINKLKDILVIKNPIISDKNDLLIHIRGGDIFVTPHVQYVPPPLSYYTNILNSTSYDKITMISEDRANPVIDKLLQMYPKITFELNDLETDIKKIMGCTNIITSYGTFIPSLLSMSNTVQNIYKVSYQFGEVLINREKVNVYVTNLNRYLKRMGKWENNSVQRDIITSYK